MNIREMQKAVLQRVSSMGEFNNTIPSEDVERALNKAIDQFINQRFQPELNRTGEGFEMSQVRIDDLRTLIVETGALSVTEVDAPFSDTIFIDEAELPAEYRHLIKVSAKVQYNRNGVTYTLSSGKREIEGVLDTDYAEKKVPCKFFQQDDVHVFTGDPFNKPKINNPKFSVNDNSLFIYTDDTFIVDEVYATYIKSPAIVDINGSTDCDLAVSTHEDIVEIAATLLLQSKGVNSQPE